MGKKRQSEFEEHEILSCCALRFDGWKYIEETGFDHQQAFETYLESGNWPADPLAQMAIFFVLQRGIGGRGLEREPEDGKYWRAYRELFLLTHSYKVPKNYRLEEYFECWGQEYQPYLPESVALVDRVHQNTRYN